MKLTFFVGTSKTNKYMTDLEQAKKELERLQDNAADMLESKYSKKVSENHKKIEKLRKLIKRLEEKRC